MLIVHHLGISQSDRIVWLCEELALPYQLIRYDRDRVTQLAPPEYRALHPFGTAPVITDDALVLGESAAIIEYVIAKYGSGRFIKTVDSPDFADYLYWFHFANGSAMPSSMIEMVGRMTGAPVALIDSLRERGDRAFAMIESRLNRSAYFAGNDFTAADIMMLFPLTTMRHFVPRDLSPYPGIRAYLARIAARPGFQRAMAKADPGFTVPMS